MSAWDWERKHRKGYWVYNEKSSHSWVRRKELKPDQRLSGSKGIGWDFQVQQRRNT